MLGGGPGLVPMGEKLMFVRLCVRILAVYSGWTFFHMHVKLISKLRHLLSNDYPCLNK